MFFSKPNSLIQHLVVLVGDEAGIFLPLILHCLFHPLLDDIQSCDCVAAYGPVVLDTQQLDNIWRHTIAACDAHFSSSWRSTEMLKDAKDGDAPPS